MKKHFFILLVPIVLMGCQNASQISSVHNDADNNTSEIVTKDTIYLPIKLKHSDYQDVTVNDDDTNLDNLLRNTDMASNSSNAIKKNVSSQVILPKKDDYMSQNNSLKLSIKPAPLENIQAETLYEQKVLERPKGNENKEKKIENISIKPIDLSILSAPIHKPIEINKNIESKKDKNTISNIHTVKKEQVIIKNKPKTVDKKKEDDIKVVH
jgi:hypothetical protein